MHDSADEGIIDSASQGELDLGERKGMGVVSWDGSEGFGDEQVVPEAV